MRAFILQRLLLLPVVLVFVAVFVFSLIRLVPGDPALVMLGDQASPADVAALRTALGLDTPGPIEFVRWFGSAVRGDLGQSLFFHTPVLPLILSRLEPTFLLTTYSMIVSIAIGIPLGTIAALRRGRIADRSITILSLFGISAPSFLVGLLLILVMAVNLRWLPSGGYRQLSEGLLPNIRSLALPTIALSLAQMTLVIRMTRSAVLDVLGTDFVRVAQAKGLPPRRVISRHVLNNAMISIVTVVGLSFAVLMGGAVVTETLFNLPGIGQLVVNSVSRRDYPVVQGVVLYVTFAVILVNLAVDILYAWIDPRIRFS
jgi:peptide/nickel transport system permease protein